MINYQVNVPMENFLQLVNALRPGGQIQTVRENAKISLRVAPKDRIDGVNAPLVAEANESFPDVRDYQETFPLEEIMDELGDDLERYRFLSMDITDIPEGNVTDFDYGITGRIYDMSRLVLEHDSVKIFRMNKEELDDLASPYMVSIDDNSEDESMVFDVRDLPYFTEGGEKIQSAEGVPVQDVLRQAIDLHLVSLDGRQTISVTPCEDGWTVTYGETMGVVPAQRNYVTAKEVYNDIKENGEKAALSAWFFG